MRLLLIEDDRELATALKLHFASDGYETDLCPDGAEAEAYLRCGGYSAVILDRMLPGCDGLSILRKMRADGDATPVLMLTALDTVRDRTDGLDAGADDYLVKPFAVPELLSRVRALMRRPALLRDTAVLNAFGLALDVRQCSLTFGKNAQTLSRREAAVLELLFENPGRVVSRAELLARVWGGEAVEEGNVDNYIYFARRRLRAAGGNAAIRTVHGVGYCLTDGGE